MARAPVGCERLALEGGVVAVIADTHSSPHPRTVEHLTKRKPDAILHAGDIGDLEVLDAFRAVAPVVAVRGNIDERLRELPDSLTVELMQKDQLVLRLFLTHIALGGVKLRADVARSALAQKVSLVVCGHSHVPFIGRDRGLSVFNPGSVGPRRFTLPIVFGLIEVKPGGVELSHMSCETGERWSP